MPTPNFILLYVASPAASERFYADLLGLAPVESSPTFAMFVFNGLKLGLWSSAGVEPAPSGTPGACELVIPVGSNAEVDETHAAWKQAGVSVIQPPATMDFGYTFTAVDPDGHRLRVYCR